MPFILFVWLLLCGFAFAEGQKVVLASLEWPPYTGRDLPGNGASAEVVRAAFKAMGYELEVEFYPWNRALDEALHNPEVVGYFPEYASDDRERGFLFSESIGKSPLGLARRSSRRVLWYGLSDLSEYQIGTVQGYVNTKPFDRLVASGVLNTDPAISDVFNLRKLVSERVDVAVVDGNVYAYLLHSDSLLRSRRGELRFENKLLAIHDLFVCFRRGENGERLSRIFNEGLDRIRPQLMQRQYMEALQVRD